MADFVSWQMLATPFTQHLYSVDARRILLKYYYLLYIFKNPSILSYNVYHFLITIKSIFKLIKLKAFKSTVQSLATTLFIPYHKTIYVENWAQASEYTRQEIYHSMRLRLLRKH